MSWVVTLWLTGCGFFGGCLLMAVVCDVLHARIDRLVAVIQGLREYVEAIDVCQDSQRQKTNVVIERLHRIEYGHHHDTAGKN